jgi:hypothetical protein
LIFCFMISQIKLVPRIPVAPVIKYLVIKL